VLLAPLALRALGTLTLSINIILSEKISELSSKPKDLNILTIFLSLTIFRSFIKGEKMAKLTLSIPRELKGRLDKMPEVNWSEVIRAGIEKKVKQLEKFEQLVSRGVI